MKMLAHLKGYSKLAREWQARCSMLVWDERKMIRDSDMAYSNRATTFSRDRHLKRAYRSIVLEPGSSLMPSFRE